MYRARWLIGVGVLTVVAWAGWISGFGRAADKAADNTAAAAGKPTASAPEASTADAGESLTVPKGGAEELLAFIDKVQAIKPPEDEAAIKPFVQRTRGAMLQAADKILADKPDAKTRLAAIQAKIGALNALENYADDAQAGKQLRELVGALQTDKQPEIAKLGTMLRVQLQVRDLMEGNATPEDAAKLWSEVKTKLAAAPDDQQNIQLALAVAQALSTSSDTKLAVRAYTDLKQLLSKSDNPRIADIAKRFDGTIRRLSLPGHSIELKGTLVNGKPFDPSSLKGKVVLVDFWATWCGPCRAELPNVKKNYEKYHDKGFDVIGISLDGDEAGDRENLKKFLSDEKIPWPIIYGGEGEPHGWDQSIATYYGIGSIPTTILTNQKGEVVSLNARGKKLGELLEQLLGK